LAKQERALATRRKILEAAATVFQQDGYRAATITDVLKLAKVTKGALYFHFTSKEELARSVLDLQRQEITVAPQPVKLQEFVDIGHVLAHRLRTEPLVRASIRLTLDERMPMQDRRNPFTDWTGFLQDVLHKARDRGEVLPHVNIEQTVHMCVGSYAGLQLMAQALTDYEDLPQRVSVFQQHVMPSIAVPPVLATLEMGPGRGAQLEAAQTETPPAENVATA